MSPRGLLVRSASVTGSGAISRAEGQGAERRAGQAGVNRYHPCGRLRQDQGARPGGP